MSAHLSRLESRIQIQCVAEVQRGFFVVTVGLEYLTQSVVLQQNSQHKISLNPPEFYELFLRKEDESSGVGEQAPKVWTMPFQNQPEAMSSGPATDCPEIVSSRKWRRRDTGG